MVGIFRVLKSSGTTTERFVDAALSGGGIGVWSWDEATGEVRWSAQQAELHGIAPQFFTGTVDDHLALVHPQDRQLVRSAMYSPVGDDRDAQRVVYRCDGTGKTRWIEARWDPHDGAGVRQQGRVGVAIDVSAAKRQEARAEREARILAGLHDATTSLVRSNGLRQTLKSVTESTAELLDAHASLAVCRADDDTDEFHVVEAGALQALWPDPEALDAPGVVDRAEALFAHSQIAVDRDTWKAPSDGPIGRLLDLPETSFRSAMAAPLRRNGDVAGVLLFAHQEPNFFSAEDRRLLGAIAAQTSMALPAATRFERQRSAVVLLQERLLPSRNVDLSGFDVCVRYRPATRGFAVGGDWFDVLEPDAGRVVAMVGDARGHGLEAAAHMAEMRFTFRALLQAGLAVPIALQQLNTMCRRELRTTATVVVAELWADSGDCHVWSAGHLPAVIGGATEHRWVDDDDHRAPVLGVIDTIDPRPTVDSLAPGEVLMLYSDGLVERRGENIDASLARLATRMAHPTGALESWCDGLLDGLAGALERDDDTALVGLRRT